MYNKNFVLFSVLLVVALFLFVVVELVFAATINTITLKYPSNNSWTNGTNNTIEFQFNWSGDELGPANCTLLMNNTFAGNYTRVANNDTNVNVYSIIAISEGHYNWTINCSVSNGTTTNVYSPERLIRVDRTVPVLTIESPTNTTYNTSTLNLNFTYGDLNSSIDRCWWLNTTNGGLAFINSASGGTCGNLTFTANSTKLLNNITVVVNDSAGNIRNVTVNFTVDLAAPVSTVSSPANNTAYTSRNLTLNATPTDNGAFDKCWYVLNGNSTSSAYSCADLNITFLAEANKTTQNITFYVNDSAGNINSSFVNFSINAVDVVNLITPVNNSWTNGTNNTVQFVYNYMGGAVAAQCKLVKNGTLDSGTNYSVARSTDVLIYSNAAFTEGSNNWSVTCNSSAAYNVTSNNFTIRIDTTAPVIVVNYPGNNTPYGTRNISLNSTHRENYAFDNCWYVLNGNNTAVNLTCPNATITIQAEANKVMQNITFYANDSAGNINYTFINFSVNIFNFAGRVLDANLNPVNITNVTLTTVAMGQNAPTYSYSALSNATGDFVVAEIDGNYTGPFTITIVAYNTTATRKAATHVGPVLPPLPKQALAGTSGMPGLNGSTIYVGTAVTINITAYNASGNNIMFKGMIFDKSLGFPISTFASSEQIQKDVVVNPNRNYSVVLFANTTPPISFDITDANLSAYVAPPRERRLNASLNVTMYWLSGYAKVAGNNSVVNWTNATKYIYISGMVPTDAIMPRFNNPQNMDTLSFTASANGNLFYNFSFPSATGLTYLLALYASTMNISIDGTPNSTTKQYAAFINVSLSANMMDYNLTLYPLAGSFVNVTAAQNLQGQVPTSKTTFRLVDASSNQEAGQAFVEVAANYSGIYTKWNLNANNSGVFQIPLWNSTALSNSISNVTGYNGVTVKVYSNRYAPRELTFSPSLLTSNATIYILLKQFEMKRPNETEALINATVYFMRSNSTCDVPEPDLRNWTQGGCVLMTAADDSFNPLRALSMGKMSLRMTQSSSRGDITIHYVGVDLLASGPPDAEYNDVPVNSSSNSSVLQDVWKFGSFGPKIYERAILGIPYLSSSVNDVGTFRMRIRYLYDQDWNVVWTLGTNTTAQVPEGYQDYLSSTYINYLNDTSPMSCSKTDTTSTCYVNTTSNVKWIVIPHFSGGGFEGEDPNDVTAPTRSLSVSSSAITAGSSTTISCSASDPSGVASTSLRVMKADGTNSTGLTCGNAFTDTSSIGTYTVTYNATDTLGNSGITTTTFITSATSSDGGGTTPGAGVVVEKKTTNTYDVIDVGVVTKVKISDPDIGLKQIIIEVKNKVNSVTIVVSKYSGQPAIVTHNITGKVYQYIEIGHQNLNDTNLKSLKIKFNVTKSWLTTNNYTASDVYLQRYNSTTGWTKLNTSKINESTNEVEYEAESPGLSVFAITAEKAALPPPAAVCGNNVREGSEQCDGTDLAGQTCEAKGFTGGTLRCSNCQFDTTACTSAPVGPTAVCGNGVCETGETQENCSKDCGAPPGITVPYWLYILIVVVIVIGVGGYIYYYKWK